MQRALPIAVPALRRWLLTSALVSITLGLLHHTDHLLRGNHIGWPFSPQVTPFTFSLLVYPLYLAGLYWTARGRLWAGYWLGVSVLGFLAAAPNHFGPFAVEPLRDIYLPWADPVSYCATSAPPNRIAFFSQVYGPLASPLWAALAVAVMLGLHLALLLQIVTAVRVRLVSGRW